MTSEINAALVSRIISQCAQTHVMPRFRALASHDVKTKISPDDLVTQADLDMEQALEAALLAAFPGTPMTHRPDTHFPSEPLQRHCRLLSLRPDTP